MKPIVSVVIPTHNRRDFLPGAINSVLAQNLAQWEVLVIDDGSSDDTADAVQPFLTDARVRYASQARQGRSAARNLGIQMARGEWVAFLDSDDRFLPNCLASHLDTTAAQPDLAMTLGGYEYVDAAGCRVGERRPWDESDLGLPAWLFNCLAMPGSVMIRREWFERVGGFDRGCEITEDWDLFLRLAHAGCKMAWVKQSVCQYRQHTGNSINSLELQSQGAIHTLHKFCSDPGLSTEMMGLASAALGWSYVITAQRALAAGEAEAAGKFLTFAVQQDPQLCKAQRGKLLEALLSAPLRTAGIPQALAAKLVRIIPPEIRLRPGELRTAAARAEMGQFFHHSGNGATKSANQHLLAALRLNPLWLLNRGVLAHCLRQALRRARNTPAAARDMA